MTSTRLENTPPVIKVTKDLLPICCPPKDQALWNLHPRVYLEFNQDNIATCSYCGNCFELVDD